MTQPAAAIFPAEQDGAYERAGLWWLPFLMLQVYNLHIGCYTEELLSNHPNGVLYSLAAG